MAVATSFRSGSCYLQLKNPGSELHPFIGVAPPAGNHLPDPLEQTRTQDNHRHHSPPGESALRNRRLVLRLSLSFQGSAVAFRAANAAQLRANKRLKVQRCAPYVRSGSGHVRIWAICRIADLLDQPPKSSSRWPARSLRTCGRQCWSGRPRPLSPLDITYGPASE
jgi:hypothetical protein